MELSQGALGPEAKYDVSIENGEVKLSLNYQGKDGHADLNLYVSPAALLDALKGKNAVADVVIGLIESVIPKG